MQREMENGLRRTSQDTGAEESAGPPRDAAGNNGLASATVTSPATTLAGGDGGRGGGSDSVVGFGGGGTMADAESGSYNSFTTFGGTLNGVLSVAAALADHDAGVACVTPGTGDSLGKTQPQTRVSPVSPPLAGSAYSAARASKTASLDGVSVDKPPSVGGPTAQDVAGRPSSAAAAKDAEAGRLCCLALLAACQPGPKAPVAADGVVAPPATHFVLLGRRFPHVTRDCVAANMTYYRLLFCYFSTLAFVGGAVIWAIEGGNTSYLDALFTALSARWRTPWSGGACSTRTRPSTARCGG
jgi:hypothetical protein